MLFQRAEEERELFQQVAAAVFCQQVAAVVFCQQVAEEQCWLRAEGAFFQLEGEFCRQQAVQFCRQQVVFCPQM